MNQEEGTPLAVPVRVTIEHITSRALLHGICTWYNARLHVLHANFALTGDYAFSSVTGCGRENRSKMWRLTEDSLRRSLGDAKLVRKEPVRRPRKPRKAKDGDPRQMKMGGT